jgi:hypothetical protein
MQAWPLLQFIISLVYIHELQKARTYAQTKGWIFNARPINTPSRKELKKSIKHEVKEPAMRK